MAQPLPNPQAQGHTASPTLGAPNLLRLWHLASLDAPTVAVVWALGFAWVGGVRLPAWLPVLLALAAFAVYVGDRLLDVRAGLRSRNLRPLRERHRFHWRHRRILLPLAVAAACVALGIVLLLMPVGARERNSVLAAAALAYFSRVHSRRNLSPPAPRFQSPLFAKELLVGILFTAGCALPALSHVVRGPGSPLWPLSAAAVFFAALAWLNCHAIERWESNCGPPVRPFPAPILLSLAGLLLAGVLFAFQPRAAALVAAGAASALLLALLDRLRNRLTPVALRAAADLVLLTPLALLLK